MMILAFDRGAALTSLSVSGCFRCLGMFRDYADALERRKLAISMAAAAPSAAAVTT